MRQFAALILLAALLFPNGPPVYEVYQHNLELMGQFQHYTMEGENPSFDVPVTNAEARMIGIFPSVDDYIDYKNNNQLFWVWGAKYTPYIEADIGDCGGDKKILQSITPILYFNFNFMDANQTVTVQNLTSNIIDVPEGLGLERGTGEKNLNVTLDWTLVFRYMFIEQLERCSTGPGGVSSCYCYEDIKYLNYFKKGEQSRLYRVGSSPKLYFLSKPVLMEQWYKNNKFQVVVLSQLPVYYAEIEQNMTLMGQSYTHNFTLAEDPYGFQRIIMTNVSINNEMTMNESMGLNTPVPLSQEDYSYYLVYLADASYEGIGKNNLTIRTRDVFLNEQERTYEITSRMHTLQGNITEEGNEETYNPDTHRPSGKGEISRLGEIVIPGSILAVLLIIIFSSLIIKK